MMQKNTRRTQRFNNNNVLQFQPEIIRAIIGHDSIRVRELLQMKNNNDHHHDMNTWIDCGCRTPLHLAAALGRDESLRVLLESDYYTINCRDNNLVTPLHRACRNNHIECVRLLIEHNADINARTLTHLTPLHVCAQMGSLDCARLLIDHVNNIDATDSIGATALHYAVYSKNLPLIELLLEHGAKVDVQDKYGLRPIHYSAMVDNKLAVIQLLIEHGQTDVNVRSKSLLTPLHIAIVEKNLDVYNALLNFGADMDVKDLYGNTIAHWAAYVGYLPIFESIIQHKANLIDIPNLNGVWPLHYLCMIRFPNLNVYPIVEQIIYHYKNNDDDDD